MIVPMKKVSLIVLQNERKEALKSLRKLGVLHVEEVQGNSEELALFRDQNTKVEKALGILAEIKFGKKETVAQVQVTREKAVDVAKSVIALADEKKSCFDRITNDSVELERFTKWGEVFPADFTELSGTGINLSMFEIPADKYGLIGDGVRTVMVNRDKVQARFLALLLPLAFCNCFLRGLDGLSILRQHPLQQFPVKAALAGQRLRVERRRTVDDLAVDGDAA